jgi:hypothetical protein
MLSVHQKKMEVVGTRCVQVPELLTRGQVPRGEREEKELDFPYLNIATIDQLLTLRTGHRLSFGTLEVGLIRFRLRAIRRRRSQKEMKPAHAAGDRVVHMGFPRTACAF